MAILIAHKSLSVFLCTERNKGSWPHTCFRMCSQITMFFPATTPQGPYIMDQSLRGTKILNCPKWSDMRHDSIGSHLCKLCNINFNPVSPLSTWLFPSGNETLLCQGAPPAGQNGLYPAKIGGGFPSLGEKLAFAGGIWFENCLPAYSFF